MKGYFRQLWLDIIHFVKLWYKFTFWRIYSVFSNFEKGKDVFTSILYRQRGRFSRPVVHTAMVAVLAMGVMLAPLLANSLPGSVAVGQAVDASPNSLSIDITDDGTTTDVSLKPRDKIEEYEVQPGDTVSGIAAKFIIDSDTVRWENNLTSVNDIKPGQILRILPVTGVAHKVARGETIYSIAKKYTADTQGIVDYPFNTFANDEDFSLTAGQILVVPEGKKPTEIPWSPTRFVAQTTPNAGVVSATGKFAWPMSGVITQRFYWYHPGIDVATAFGTPILAADAGQVVVAGWPDNSGYGNRVIIDHKNGFSTLYGHMSKVLVSVGQTVRRGDKIGLEGSTGRSTGPHLHFEIRRTGSRNVNPLDYLK